MPTTVLTSVTRHPNSNQFGYDKFIFDIKDSKKEEQFKNMNQFLRDMKAYQDKVLKLEFKG